MPLSFYSVLFLAHPQTRRLFPPSMAAQRDRLVAAPGAVVAQVDDPDHLAHFLGQEWTDELADPWARAYQVVSATMLQAAQAEADSCPP